MDTKHVTTDPNVLTIYGSSENSYHPSSPHAVVASIVITLYRTVISKIIGSTQNDGGRS